MFISFGCIFNVLERILMLLVNLWVSPSIPVKIGLEICNLYFDSHLVAAVINPLNVIHVGCSFLMRKQF